MKSFVLCVSFVVDVNADAAAIATLNDGGVVVALTTAMVANIAFYTFCQQNGR